MINLGMMKEEGLTIDSKKRNLGKINLRVEVYEDYEISFW